MTKKIQEAPIKKRAEFMRKEKRVTKVTLASARVDSFSEFTHKKVLA